MSDTNKNDLRFLRSILTNKIGDYNSKIDLISNMEFQLSFYNEILPLLRTNPKNIKDNFDLLNMQLLTIYPDAVFTKISKNILNSIVVLNNDKDDVKAKTLLRSTYNKIKTDYNELKTNYIITKKEISDKTDIISEYKKIVSNIKNHYLINPKQIDLLIDIAIDYEFEEVDMAYLFNFIKINNDKVKHYKGNDNISFHKLMEFNEELYTTDELLSYNERERLDNLVHSYEEWDRDDNFIEGLELLPRLDDIDYDDFCFLYKSLMNKYIKQINEYKSFLSDKENFFDVEMRNLIYHEFRVINKKYTSLKFIYNSEILKYNSCKQIEDVGEAVIVEDVNNIMFLPTNNNKVSFIEKDLKDIPNEYLDKVLFLIDGFKTDTLK